MIMDSSDIRTTVDPTEWQFGLAGKIRRLEASLNNDRRRLLLVHGYLNNDKSQADYDPLVKAVREAGWSGAIYGVVWDGGDALGKIESIARRIAWLGVPVPGPHSIWIFLRLGYFAYSVRNCWIEACTRADEAGRSLGKHFLLQSRFDPDARWTIAAHSLGCRLTYEALNAIGGTQGIIDNVFLCGGAVSTQADWSTASACVADSVVNCYSENDKVLRYFFQLAHWERPIGLGPISSRAGNFSNHDCSAQVGDHFSYHQAFVDIFETVLAQHDQDKIA